MEFIKMEMSISADQAETITSTVLTNIYNRAIMQNDTALIDACEILYCEILSKEECGMMAICSLYDKRLKKKENLKKELLQGTG